MPRAATPRPAFLRGGLLHSLSRAAVALAAAASVAWSQTPPADPHAVDPAVLAAVGVSELPTPPTVEELEARIASRLPAGEAAAAEVALLRQALESVQQWKTEQAAADQTRLAIGEAPQALVATRTQIAGIDLSPDRFAKLAEETANDSFESVQRRADEAKAQLVNAREAIGVRDAARLARASRSTALPEEIVAATREAGEVAQGLSVLLAGDPTRQRAETIASLARLWRLLAKVRSLRMELERIDATAEAATARDTLAQLQLQAAQQASDAWQRVLTARVEARAREREAAAREALARVADASPLLRRVAAENVALSERFGELGELGGSSDDLASSLRREASALKRMVISERRRQAIDPRTVVSAELLENLPRISSEPMLTRELESDRLRRLDLDLRLVDLQERRDDLQDLPGAVNEMLDGAATVPDADRAAIAAALTELLKRQRDELIPQLVSENRRTATSLEQLEAARRLLLESIAAYREFLQANMFSLRTSPPIRLGSFSESAAGFRDAASQLDLLAVPRLLRTAAATRPFEWIASLGILLALLGMRRWCTRTLAETAAGIARITTDRFGLTLKAAAATILLALPLPLLLFFIAWQVRSDLDHGIDPGPIVMLIGGAIERTLSMVGLLCLLIAANRPGGLEECHFRSESGRCRLLRRTSLLVLLTVPAAMLVARVIVVSPAALDADGVATGADAVAAQLLMAASTLMNALAFAYLLHPRLGVFRKSIDREPGSLLARTRWLWFGLSLLALGLPAYAACQGFGFAALIGTERLVASLWVVAAVAFGRQLLVRWLSATSRRIAAEQLAKRREAASEAGGGDRPGGTPEFDETQVEREQVDLAALNEQTMRIIRSGAFTGLLIGLLVVWSSTVPAFEGLREVTLWSTMRKVPMPGGEGATPMLVPVSLFDLGGGLLALLLTVVVTRNVPGLVELIILGRLPISSGARYAVVTLTRYLLAIVGGSTVLSLLGVTWDNIQWLVGAAVVGLAFGFQEIVKNFVSGVILLVEQPIRVGDIVTVGGTTGRVSRISLRATTVVDWDRKELVIPNSGFITSQFTNWTLSDLRTRQVIRVGVAYGSDYRLVERLLVESALAQADVARDPAPAAILVEFGDSSVNFDLRLVIDDVGRISPTVHAVRLAIADALTKHGIEIPFPQRDLHLRSVDPAAAAAIREPKT
jgi:potassium efflux system protein